MKKLIVTTIIFFTILSFNYAVDANLLIDNYDILTSFDLPDANKQTAFLYFPITTPVTSYMLHNGYSYSVLYIKNKDDLSVIMYAKALGKKLQVKVNDAGNGHLSGIDFVKWQIVGIQVVD